MNTRDEVKERRSRALWWFIFAGIIFLLFLANGSGPQQSKKADHSTSDETAADEVSLRKALKEINATCPDRRLDFSFQKLKPKFFQDGETKAYLVHCWNRGWRVSAKNGTWVAVAEFDLASSDPNLNLKNAIEKKREECFQEHKVKQALCEARANCPSPDIVKDNPRPPESQAYWATCSLRKWRITLDNEGVWKAKLVFTRFGSDWERVE